MSTVKATYIQHPSASSPNFTLAADGSVSGGAGLGGLVHIHTEEFTTASSVSIDDVFSATYKNYRVMMNLVGSTTGEPRIRMRASGTDNTASSYTRMRLRVILASASPGQGTATYAQVGDFAATGGSVYLDLFDPFATADTQILALSVVPSVPIMEFIGVRHAVSSSYDGFTISTSTGTITGTLRVYGYKD